jgi:hypothetical protein
MSEISREEWARRLLEDQLLRLGELRNANPRDAGFKLWRQTTLTVIQRIWPTDLARSERFRRIPFTTPSSKATATHLKQTYERGCVEAASYLKSLIRELETGGLETDAPADSAETAEPAAPKLEISEQALRRAEIPEDSYGAPLPDLTPPATPAPPAQPLSKAPPPTGPAPPTPAEAARPNPVLPRLDDRRALKEMLGFADLRGGERLSKHPAAKRQDAPDSLPPDDDELEMGQDPDEMLEEEELLDEGALIEDEEDQPPRQEPPMRPAVRPVPEKSGDLAIQFLSRSPVLSAVPKPPAARQVPEVKPVNPPAKVPPAEPPAKVVPTHPTAKPAQPPVKAPIEALANWPPAQPAAKPPAQPPAKPAAKPPAQPPAKTLEIVGKLEPQQPVRSPDLSDVSPATAALTALAVQIAALGVPAAQRTATRAALLELANELEQGTATWESLRGVLTTVLEHPQLARRVVPLLIPYLDLE